MSQLSASERPARKPRPANLKLSAFAAPRVRHALSFLKAKGLLGRKASRKVSARLDPDLMEAARAKIGADNDTDLLTAALAIAAGEDDFGAWLVARRATNCRGR